MDDREMGRLVRAAIEGNGDPVVAVEALRAWAEARSEGNPRRALYDLSRMDAEIHRWCAAKVARAVLHLVPPAEGRPLKAIEAAERYARAEASWQDLVEARDGAAAAAREEFNDPEDEYACTPATAAMTAAFYAAAGWDAGDAAMWAVAAGAKSDSLCQIIWQSLPAAMEAAILYASALHALRRAGESAHCT